MNEFSERRAHFRGKQADFVYVFGGGFGGGLAESTFAELVVVGEPSLF